MSDNRLVDVKNVYKIFRTKEVETYAVNDISFSIDRGEYIAISGPSGGGKSTALSILGLLDYPTEGTYLFNGINTVDMKRSQLCSLRNQEIGFIFQSFNLIESLTVLDNVMLPIIHRKNVSRNEAEKRANEALERVDMQHRKNHYPTQLSGGQQQRVAVARAIIVKPSIILADEPTGNLDSRTAEMVMELIKEQHDAGTTVCIVTHDPRYTKDATRLLSFADGSIVS